MANDGREAASGCFSFDSSYLPHAHRKTPVCFVVQHRHTTVTMVTQKGEGEKIVQSAATRRSQISKAKRVVDWQRV